MKIHDKQFYYGLTDIAEMIGHTTSHVWQMAYITQAINPPTVVIGRRQYYTQKQFDKIVKEFCTTLNK